MLLKSEGLIVMQVDDPVAAYQKLRSEVDRYAYAAGRDPGGVEIVIASKRQSADRIAPLLAEGCRVFGENRVQEAAEKWPALRERTPDCELRMIGRLQSNKAPQAFQLFDVIETVDRESLAQAIAHEAQKTGRCPALYVQVNTGCEPQKGGVLPNQADAFIERCRKELGLPVTGLMCIPPSTGHASPHFAMLAEIARRNGLADLSMGMSADYPLAIQLGATHVRLGSAIFGER